MIDQARLPDEPPSAPRGGRPPRRMSPPAWVWAFVAGLGLLAVLLWWTDAFGDHAAANVSTWILSFLAVLVLLGWCLLLSGWSPRARLRLLAACVALVGGFLALFRVDQTSGELMPSFALRFSAKPDQELAMPEAEPPAAAQRPVDLRTTTADDFPQFLGPDRNATLERGHLDADQPLPPPLVWKQPIGAGWSAFAVRNGYAVTMEQRGDQELVTCYEVATGRLRWFHAKTARYDTISGGVGPRSTPTIAEGKVFALGATGRLVCLDGATGRLLWEKDLLAEFGVTPEEERATIPWGRAASPLVVGDRVIVPAGGKVEESLGSLAAFDARDGHLLWKGGGRQISYSSPALATLAGVEQVLIVNEDTASGHDPRTGRVLWEHPWEGRSNREPNVSQAVPIPPDRVFLSKGYGLGATLLALRPQSDGSLAPEVLWANPKAMRTKFTNVTIDGRHVYGLSDGVLQCLDLTDGQSVWKEGRYRHGQLLRVGHVLVVLSESGEIVLVEATPERANHVLGRFQALEGKCWANFALAGPYLLLRNAKEAACYRLGIRD